jgi:hypothetical protein
MVLIALNNKNMIVDNINQNFNKKDYYYLFN